MKYRKNQGKIYPKKLKHAGDYDITHRVAIDEMLKKDNGEIEVIHSKRKGKHYCKRAKDHKHNYVLFIPDYVNSLCHEVKIMTVEDYYIKKKKDYLECIEKNKKLREEGARSRGWCYYSEEMKCTYCGKQTWNWKNLKSGD